MFRLVFASLWLAVSMLAGCAQQQCSRSNGGGYAGSPVAPLPSEMQAQRGSISPDLTAMASYQEVDRILSPPPVPVQYRVLRAIEVQCLAATNAPLAKLYTSESKAVLASAGGHSQQAACVQSKLMAYRTVDERNKAAGTALELFYSLAEAEANHDILNRGIDEVDRAIANLDQLKLSGLNITLDRTALNRQKLDWLDRRIQLNAAQWKLQGQLQQICGFEGDPTTPIWPQADLTVTIVPTDMQAAIDEGLANRADLGALRMLNASLSVETLPAARSGIQAVSPGLGTSILTRRLLGGSANGQEELYTRQSQLSQAWSDLERTIAREISEAAQNVETRLREIAVANGRCQLWQERHEQLKVNRETNGVTAFDLSAVQLEQIRAESDKIHRVIAWKIAQAKLKQSQGLLAPECGYYLPNCCP